MPGESGGMSGTVNPVVILGIIVFIIPVIGNFIKWKLPGWVSGLGIALIVIGAILTIIQKVNE